VTLQEQGDLSALHLWRHGAVCARVCINAKTISEPQRRHGSACLHNGTPCTAPTLRAADRLNHGILRVLDLDRDVRIGCPTCHCDTDDDLLNAILGDASPGRRRRAGLQCLLQRVYTRDRRLQRSQALSARVHADFRENGFSWESHR
jgi:hypothetical protein